MKFTFGWLKDHLETDCTLEEIGDALTMIGHELEGIEDPSKPLEPFIVGYVTEAKRHPDADRLQVCMVDIGSQTIQVVCGAPNARAGMKGVFAPSGSHIPGTGVDLKPGVIRGVESNGMLCSEREMGLSDDHEGIIELPDDSVVGTKYSAIAGLNDPVIEIGITPNRGDCLGVRGVARDLAAAGYGTLKPLKADPVQGTFKTPIRWERAPDLGDDCPMAVGRTFKGVKNGPSPVWMQRRLKAIGLRPISALVDITNYVTHDLGRPLHVFDADKLDGDTLTIHHAKAGETILALDGREYTLEDGMVVISDAKGVQGIGGVMGGELSGCTEDTVNVFLEVALFDPIRTAETGRKLGINSDARYRFERGVDPVSEEWGPEVAARLVLDLCGGKVSDLSIAGEQPKWQRTYDLRVDRLAQMSGVEIPANEAARHLENLGFRTEVKGNVVSAAVPSWRSDVEGEHCLIEEVLRMHGYSNVPAVSLERETNLPVPALSPQQRRVSYARKGLAMRGMMEAVTWSFMSSEHVGLFGGVTTDMEIANPISSELDVMRPSILPNLLTAAARNIDRGYPDVALFEVGPAFSSPKPDGQATVAAGIRTGRNGPRHWNEKTRPVDVFDAKADAIGVLEVCGAPVDNLQVSTDAPEWYHPGRSGCLRLGPNVLARFGEVHPKVLKALGIKGRAVAFEAMLDAIPIPKSKAKGKTKPLLVVSPFQPITRDFAFLADRDVAADRLARSAAGADKALIENATVFDVYEGAELEGKRSIAVTVTIQPKDHTLTDKEIEAVAEKVVANVAKQTGATLRT